MELSTDRLGWDDPKRGPTRPWAVVNEHNTGLFLSLARCEEAMWTWYLGWPDEDEIAAARAKGLRVTMVTVSVNGSRLQSS